MSTNPPKEAAKAATPPPINSSSTDMPPFKAILLALALFALCLLSLYFSQFNGSWGTQEHFGTFGDFLGGVLNPVLGFATVGLLIWSIKKQGEELALSREELAFTRQELAETKVETALSRKAMEDQVEHLKKEANISELLKLTEEIRSRIHRLLDSNLTMHFIDDEDNSHILLPFNTHTPRMLFSGQLEELSQREIHLLRLQHKKEFSDALSIDSNCQDFKLWCELHDTAIIYANLIVDYLKKTQSTSFALVYSKEVYQILLSLSSILCTKAVSEQISQLEDVLDLVNGGLDFLYMNKEQHSYHL